MKTSTFLILSISILFSCKNSSSEQGNEGPKQNEKSEQQSKEQEKNPTKHKVKDDDRVSGYFDIKIDGESYKSTQLSTRFLARLNRSPQLLQHVAIRSAQGDLRTKQY